MGLFGGNDAPVMMQQAPPPPPPLPPAAHPATLASGDVQAVAAKARARAQAANGAGFENTKLTKPGATGAGPVSKANLLGETSV